MGDLGCNCHMADELTTTSRSFARDIATLMRSGSERKPIVFEVSLRTTDRMMILFSLP